MYGTDDISDWELFLAVFETLSIRKAAAMVGVESPVASRRLAALEKRLGRRLFLRDCRPFVPTADAQAILKSAKDLVASRRAIRRYLAEQQDGASDIVRVMLGNSFRAFAPRMISEYSALYPELRFNLISPIDIQEYLDGQADIVAVSGNVDLGDSVLLPRGRMIFVPVASPAYIERHGPVHSPEDLAGRRVFTNLFPNRHSFSVSFPLVKGRKSVPFSAIETIRWSNVEMVMQAAIDGEGIAACLPLFLCVGELEAGRLVPVLGGWHRASQDNFIACKENDWKIRHIRMFASWWADKLAAHEKECEARFAAMFGSRMLKELGS